MQEPNLKRSSIFSYHVVETDGQHSVVLSRDGREDKVLETYSNAGAAEALANVLTHHALNMEFRDRIRDRALFSGDRIARAYYEHLNPNKSGGPERG